MRIRKILLIGTMVVGTVFAGGVIESEIYRDDDIVIKVERKKIDPVIIEKEVKVEVPVRDTKYEDELKLDISLKEKQILDQFDKIQNNDNLISKQQKEIDKLNSDIKEFINGYIEIRDRADYYNKIMEGKIERNFWENPIFIAIGFFLAGLAL